jgi:hypothetical protein
LVNLFSIFDHDYPDLFFHVVYLVNDPVTTYAQLLRIDACELLCAKHPRILLELGETLYYFVVESCGKSFEFLNG